VLSFPRPTRPPPTSPPFPYTTLFRSLLPAVLAITPPAALVDAGHPLQHPLGQTQPLPRRGEHLVDLVRRHRHLRQGHLDRQQAGVRVDDPCVPVPHQRELPRRSVWLSSSHGRLTRPGTCIRHCPTCAWGVPHSVVDPTSTPGPSPSR